MRQYTLKRSDRKTIAIYITKDARVEVRAPLKMTKPDIDKFVASKEDWIAPRIAEKEKRNGEKAAFTLGSGSMLSLRGKEYPLTERDGNQIGFDGECFYVPPGLTQEELRDSLIKLYKLLAKRILPAKAAEFSKKMGLYPSSVKINGAKTRWGSCSGKNSVNFSWRLLMADEDVIDYVVIHELSHIAEHNHSQRFWSLVSTVVPDHERRKLKLRNLQDKLSREDWG